MFKAARDAVALSRPGFYLITVWVWVVGYRIDVVEGDGGLARAAVEAYANAPAAFFVGLAYCTFPLNYLLYTWNDLGDAPVDEESWRKRGPYGVGARAGTATRGHQLAASLLQVPFLYHLVHVGAIAPMALVTRFVVPAVALNVAYNDFDVRSGPPPLDLVLGSLGYVLVADLAAQCSSAVLTPAAVAFHVVLVARSHLWGQLFDFAADAAGGRRTTAIALCGSPRNTRAVLAALVACELVAARGVGDPFVSAFSSLSLCVAVFSLVWYRDRVPGFHEALIAAVLQTPVAALLLARCAAAQIFTSAA